MDRFFKTAIIGAVTLMLAGSGFAKGGGDVAFHVAIEIFFYEIGFGGPVGFFWHCI